MSVNTITASSLRSIRSPERLDRRIGLADRFGTLRDYLELTKRATVAGSLLLTVIAGVLGYGYLGPVLSDVISTTALVLLASATAPFFKGR